MRKPYFLPYQQRFLADDSQLRIWEKSRRIGATWTLAFESVQAAIRRQGAVETFFSSASITTAREFISDCLVFAQMYNVAAQDLGETGIDEDKGVLAHVLMFANGKRIVALSSNPTNFRGRGRRGDRLILDEYAFHKGDDEMWRAVVPAITWGGSLSILSSHNGLGTRFYRIMDEARRDPDSPWSVHRTTIHDAVADGLADKIVGRSLTDAERSQWIEQLRRNCGDEYAWQQEYCCNSIDSATAWLPWALIAGAEHSEAGAPSAYGGGLCYVGFDVARRRDLSVLWVCEAVGDLLWTREVVCMKGATFAEQMDRLRSVMEFYRVVMTSIDQTGMGEMVVDEARRLFGATRVSGVLFTGPVKQDLAIALKQRFEDRRLRIPSDKAIRDDHHAVRRVTTAAGNPRFDADRTELGHADRFWAHALAVHGAVHGGGPFQFQSSPQRCWADSPQGLGGFGFGDRPSRSRFGQTIF